MIMRREKAIFVGFKKSIGWQSQELISSVKKGFFQTLTRLPFWLAEFLFSHFSCMLYNVKCLLGSKLTFDITSRVTRNADMIIQQEKVIFVGFKKSIGWHSQEPISSVKKSFFETLTRLPFWLVEFCIRIFHEGYTYVKCSLESKLTFGIT